MTINRNLWLVLVFLGPSGLMFFVTRNAANVRLAIIWFVLAAGVALLMWTSLDPKTEFIRPGGKLYTSPSRPRVEKAIRIATAGLALALAGLVGGPVAVDTIQLISSRQPPRSEIAQVVDSYMVFGTWFLYQKLAIRDPDGSHRREVYLVYSPQVMRVGRLYELTVLPHSRMVLSATPTAGVATH